MTEAYFLAVDGGGTKTQVLCADATGQVVGEGLSGPTNLTATSIGAASFNLREGVRQATEKLPEGVHFTRLAMGLAGMDTSTEHDQAKQIFTDVLSNFPIHEFLLMNDSLIALESGTDEADALVIVSGTGSNCFGRNQKGEEAKAGGMDYLLTDQGSGYDIGRSVLREAVKSFDGRTEKSLLEQLVAEHFKIPSIADLKDKVYKPDLTKSEVADLARVCVAAFEQGDLVAGAILRKAIDDLLEMIEAVVHRLDIANEALVCVQAGKLFTVPHIKQAVDAKLLEFHPQIKIVVPEKGPVYGALKLALGKDGMLASSEEIEQTIIQDM